MRQLLSGNEAIARGAYEAGVKVATGYPGTPSTEILETIIQWPEVRAQWSPNEKVAVEVALGAALAGGRALVTMKHVGLNVAADPLFTAAYTGVHAGLVIVTADDPGMHSSQNEQDSRHYARAAKVPILEPSDSAEALQMVHAAFEISERYDTPVLLRSTTRISHSKSVVTVGERVETLPLHFERNIRKYVMVPANARERRKFVEQRLAALAAFAEETDLNRVEIRSRKIGVVTSGISYQYVRDAAPEASVLKIGMPFPLPLKRVRDFASQVDRLYVVEELEPFIEHQVQALGIPAAGRSLFLSYGELDASIVARGISSSPIGPLPPPVLNFPARPPVMCPGCPHRAVFRTLADLGVVVFGDIGCYSLGASPPLGSMDTLVCMGAGVGMAHGAELVGHQGPTVAVIGDSTFVHSGITPLIDLVYNGGTSTVLILDNRTTAMTGRQENPATGRTIMGDAAPALDLEALVRAVGVKDVHVVDPYNMVLLKIVLERAFQHPGPSVVIVQRACVLLDRKTWKPGLVVDEDACLACGICGELGCPGLRPGVGLEEPASIDAALCTGCGECVHVCPFHAIVEHGKETSGQ